MGSRVKKPRRQTAIHFPSIMNKLCLLSACLLACAPLEAQESFEYGGLTRTYFMDAPDPIPAGAPLVFVLHGYSSSAQLIRAYSNWDALAINEGFVAVYPQGTDDNFGISHWNANFGSSTVNDHGFLVALAQHLQSEYDLSPDCTYSCGMSNGGFMSYSLACTHPEVFSAVGSVTGSMSAADAGCTPSTVVPIVHLHGTADATVSYENGVGGGAWGDAGVTEIIDHWTGLMGTTAMEESPLPNQEVVDLTSVDFLRYYGAPGGQEFHHYRVNDGGHDWFGVWGSQDIEATEILWDFFSAQCNGAFTDVEEESAASLLLVPRGSGFQAAEYCEVKVYDLLGRCESTLALEMEEVWSPEFNGMRLIIVSDEKGRTQTLRIR